MALALNQHVKENENKTPEPRGNPQALGGPTQELRCEGRGPGQSRLPPTRGEAPYVGQFEGERAAPHRAKHLPHGCGLGVPDEAQAGDVDSKFKPAKVNDCISNYHLEQ